MREPYGTIYFMVIITKKRSEGHCGRRHTPLVGVKKGRKNGRKKMMAQSLHNNNNNNNNNNDQ